MVILRSWHAAGFAAVVLIAVAGCICNASVRAANEPPTIGAIGGGEFAAPAWSAATDFSPNHCAVAWNRFGSAAERQAVARSEIQAADIDANAMVGKYAVIGGVTHSTRSPGCVITFVLPHHGGLLTTAGTWQAGTVRIWRQLHRSIYFPMPLNAHVQPDGTVRFTR